MHRSPNLDPTGNRRWSSRPVSISDFGDSDDDDVGGQCWKFHMKELFHIIFAGLQK